MCQTGIANIEGWPVLNWLVHVSSSSCKGTFDRIQYAQHFVAFHVFHNTYSKATV